MSKFEITGQEIKKITDKFQQIRGMRASLAEKFISGKRPYLIFQTLGGGKVWSDVRTPEQCFYENMKYLDDSLAVVSDHLPVIEPWFGTGVYANMYGCPYVWRDGEAPAVHYKYLSLEELRGLKKPGWEKSDIAKLVLDTIKYIKARTGNNIPIIFTDPQSACDTATLITDASEVFTGCLLEPELVFNYMQGINDLLIEFSRVQAELIGDALVKPGHIMLCNDGLTGYSLSDDNLAVASPQVNETFNLVFDEQVGKAFGGVAIHSCGNWSQTMPLVKKIVPSCVAIDCALDKTCDPNPNEPEKVRDAFAGSGIHVHIRMTGETAKMLEIVRRALHQEIKYIIHPDFIDLPTAEQNYAELNFLLSAYYKTRARAAIATPKEVKMVTR